MTSIPGFDIGSVERVLRPLLETPSEQTDLFEDDPQIRAFLQTVVADQFRSNWDCDTVDRRYRQCDL